ncbi:MAG: hypothetical protein ABIJ56_03495 [Pseudomonadota bacterium]
MAIVFAALLVFTFTMLATSGFVRMIRRAEKREDADNASGRGEKGRTAGVDRKQAAAAALAYFLSTNKHREVEQIVLFRDSITGK